MNGKFFDTDKERIETLRSMGVEGMDEEILNISNHREEIYRTIVKKERERFASNKNMSISADEEIRHGGKVAELFESVDGLQKDSSEKLAEQINSSTFKVGDKVDPGYYACENCGEAGASYLFQEVFHACPKCGGKFLVKAFDL